jgi:hypothetical protein
MLMRPGEQVEIRTKNAVASVRGTDFIVETLAVPSQAQAFGLLGVRQVAQAMADTGSQAGETVVVTLSGVVDVSNRLAGTGRVESVRAHEAVRVSGRQDPLRLQLTGNDLRVLLQGLTPPRPQEARSGDKSEAVGRKVEGVALATSAQNVRVFERSGGDGGGSGRQNAPAAATPATPAVPATPAAGAGPATPAVPAIPATPAVAATPSVPAAPPAAIGNPGNGNKPATPPGQGKK